MKYKNLYEDEHVEFKKTLSQLDRGIESLVAMLNKHGFGKVVFGIENNAEVVGLEDIGEETIKKVATRIIEAVLPFVTPHIELQNLDGKTVLEVDVHGDKRPYSCFGNYFIRIGSENRKVFPDQMGDLAISNTSILSGNIESINQDLTFNGLKSLYTIRGFSINDDTFAHNAGLLTQSGKYNFIADILSDNNNCSIKVVRFKGKDKVTMLSRTEFGYKCMLLAMQQAYEYTLSFNETRVDLEKGLIREETKLFDERCLEEAWNNACLHNRWVRNIPPAINIFSDRIEVVSTGGLPLDFSKEEFYRGISHPINPTLFKIMGQLQFIEQTGHGVPKIVSKYGKEAFEFYPNHIIVKIPFAFTPSFAQSGNDLPSNHRLILNLLSDNPSLKISQLCDVTKLKKTRVSEILTDLKKLNKIIRVGSNKSGYWKVIKE